MLFTPSSPSNHDALLTDISGILMFAKRALFQFYMKQNLP